jgi:hypothetical protein
MMLLQVAFYNAKCFGTGCVVESGVRDGEVGELRVFGEAVAEHVWVATLECGVVFFALQTYEIIAPDDGFWFGEVTCGHLRYSV